MNSIKVTAVDQIGNLFEKTARPIQGTGFFKGKLIIDFGYPMQYHADFLMKSYPFQKPLCIDEDGKLHKGSKVVVSAKQMNKVMEFFANQYVIN